MCEPVQQVCNYLMKNYAGHEEF